MQGTVKYNNKRDTYSYINKDGSVVVDPIDLKILIAVLKYNHDSRMSKDQYWRS